VKQVVLDGLRDVDAKVGHHHHGKQTHWIKYRTWSYIGDEEEEEEEEEAGEDNVSNTTKLNLSGRC